MLGWYRTFFDLSGWENCNALIPANIIVIGCHIFIRSITSVPVVAQWAEAARRGMLANGEERVLENDLNYSEFKNKPMIVVSDAMTSYPPSERESLGPGGIGHYLATKLGYTQVVDVCFSQDRFATYLQGYIERWGRVEHGLTRRYTFSFPC
jgi:hypothetical protein